MSIKGKAYIVGIYRASDAQGRGQIARSTACRVRPKGALEDAGLTQERHRRLFLRSGDAPGLGRCRWPIIWA